MDIPANEVIITNNCLLRYMYEQDLPFIWSASRSTGFNNGLTWEPAKYFEELKHELQQSLASWHNGSAYVWTIEHDESGDFVGQISIRKQIVPNDWAIEFWIHPEHQGKGFAFESAQAILRFGFERLSANTILASHAQWQPVCAELLARIGMIKVGDNPCGFQKQGQCIAVFEYELSKDHWQSNNSAY